MLDHKLDEEIEVLSALLAARANAHVVATEQLNAPLIQALESSNNKQIESLLRAECEELDRRCRRHEDRAPVRVTSVSPRDHLRMGLERDGQLMILLDRGVRARRALQSYVASRSRLIELWDVPHLDHFSHVDLIGALADLRAQRAHDVA